MFQDKRRLNLPRTVVAERAGADGEGRGRGGAGWGRKGAGWGVGGLFQMKLSRTYCWIKTGVRIEEQQQQRRGKEEDDEEEGEQEE